MSVAFKGPVVAAETDPLSVHSTVLDAVSGVAVLGTDGRVAQSRLPVRGLSSIRAQAFPAVLASPPTLTQGVKDAATTISGSVLKGPTNAAFRYSGAEMVTSAQGALYLATKVPTGHGVANPGDDLPACVEFETDCDKFEWVTDPIGGSYRLWVGDQVVSLTPTTLTANFGNAYMLVDFGSRANRRIRIEGQQLIWGGIRIHPTCSIWRPTVPVGPRVAIVGDSYTQGGGLTYKLWSYVYNACRLLGLGDIWPVGLGGTGYVNANSISTFGSRLAADVLPYNPDIVLFVGSINDNGLSGIQAAALAAWQQVLTALPRCKVIALGPLRSNSGNSSDVVTNTALLAAAAQEPRVTYIDTVTSPPFTGTGTTAATNGSGNSDFYANADGVHANQAGHEYLARWVAAALKDYLPVT